MFMPFFFFNDPATAEIYTYCTLSLHDALPISAHVVAVDVVVHIDVPRQCRHARGHFPYVQVVQSGHGGQSTDRLGNRDWRSEEHTSELQSLMRISYAVFCLKKNRTAKASI